MFYITLGTYICFDLNYEWRNNMQIKWTIDIHNLLMTNQTWFQALGQGWLHYTRISALNGNTDCRVFKRVTKLKIILPKKSGYVSMFQVIVWSWHKTFELQWIFKKKLLKLTTVLLSHPQVILKSFSSHLIHSDPILRGL